MSIYHSISSVLIIFLLFNTFGAKASDVSYLFEKVEKRYRIPSEVMRSLCETESALNGVLQPYAVNIKGKSLYYSDANSAFRAIKTYQKSVSSIKEKWLIDVGMCQVNMYWHRDQIPLNDNGILALLKPRFNIGYAAYFLNELWAKNSSLKVAVGKYHSPSSPERAAAYRVRVAKKLEAIEVDSE